MTENQAEVLEGLNQMGWLRPMDFGGSNGSHHGVTARRMEKQGWVEWRYCGHEPGEKLRHMKRGSCLYRITAKGAQALVNHRISRGMVGA